MSVSAAAPQLLLAAAAVLFVLVLRAALALEDVRRELREAEAGLREEGSDLLTAAGFATVAGAELAWARREGIPTAIVVLQVHALAWRDAVDAVARIARRHEPAGLVGEREVAVALWDAGPDAARLAAQRLAASALGGPVLAVSTGWATTDEHAADADLEALLGSARRRLAPTAMARPTHSSSTAA